MVAYEYLCLDCGDLFVVRARAGEAPARPECDCGGVGRRQYSRNINWNGVELHPTMRRLIDDAPRRRDEYAAQKEGA